MGGACLSAGSVEGEVNSMFHDSEAEVWFGEVRLQPMLYQDDVMRPSEGRAEAQMGNTFMETVAESKLLSFNQDKSNFMVIGAKNIKKKMVEELEKNPLTLGGSNMKQAGDYV